MPVVYSNGPSTPWWQINGHLQTIPPNLLRRVGDVGYERERIETWDHDFLDLDWSVTDSKKLVLITHGMEGNTNRQYVRGLVKAANKRGFDALAWNLRGCSGEPNKLLTAYHSGKTDDLHYVIEHAIGKCRYDAIYLVGISLGGNITLKYAGDGEHRIPTEVTAAVAVSVPCDLVSASRKIISGWNRIYSRRFLHQCLDKVKTKMDKHPDAINYEKVLASQTLLEFTSNFTAPLHGYADADDYHSAVQSLDYVSGIKIPTLLVNAQNDPFLTPTCFPVREAEANPHLTLEITQNGGHVGFDEFLTLSSSWLDNRVMQYLEVA